MPLVTVHLLEGRTEAQKAAAAKAICTSLAEALGVQPSSTQVIFSDVPATNWAHGGELVSQRQSPDRKK